MNAYQDHYSSNDLEELAAFSEQLVEMAMDIEDDETGERLIHIGARLRGIALRDAGGDVPDVWAVLRNLVEAVGRGDEHGLPEAYRAAVALLRDDAPLGASR